DCRCALERHRFRAGVLHDSAQELGGDPGDAAQRSPLRPLGGAGRRRGARVFGHAEERRSSCGTPNDRRQGRVAGEEGFAKGYPNCRMSNPRFCAHSIADDFHKEVRQLDGVARTKLAFVSDRDATRVVGRPSQTQAVGKEIYISDYDGANQLRLTVNRSLNISPAWAPGGNLLAYTSYSSGFPDIYI